MQISFVFNHRKRTYLIGNCVNRYIVPLYKHVVIKYKNVVTLTNNQKYFIQYFIYISKFAMKSNT